MVNFKKQQFFPVQQQHTNCHFIKNTSMFLVLIYDLLVLLVIDVVNPSLFGRRQPQLAKRSANALKKNKIKIDKN